MAHRAGDACGCADPLLGAQLEVAGGADSRQAYDDSNPRASLTKAILIDAFVDYGGAYGYFREVDDAQAEVEGLTDQGFPDAAIELTEYALELLEESAGMVDDSVSSKLALT